MKTAAYWIDKLKLEKHPEGGWYREIYLSDDIVPQTGLPSGFRGERSFATSIYYLLEGNDFSAFHRIKSDEIWHYYTGTSVIEILSLEKGTIKKYLV
ncbi:MAG: cupin domain-containing protein, partial [Bacteroidales bacterium]|nr:cupin domain-containing protein [Bacteroidales bacterium]